MSVSTRRSRPSAPRFGLLLPAILFTIAACGDDDPTDPGTINEAGSYALVSANGQNLPVTITGTALGTVVIQSGTMTLTRGASTSTYTAVVRGSANGMPTADLLTDAGTYTVAGATVTFASTAATLSYAGAVTSTQITVSVPGAAIGTTGTLTLVLRKS